MERDAPQKINSERPASVEAPPPERMPRKENFFGDIVRFALIAFIIVLPIRLFVAQPFIVQGASMQPTFETGQYLIVDQISYRFAPPERGEIIIFRHPNMPSTFLIKRVIGLPGETVELKGRTVTIKNSEHPKGMALDEPYVRDEGVTYTSQTVTLGLGEYFVLGDNRGASSDSRVWGPLDQEFIVGEAFLRLLPIGKSGIHPGDFNSS